MKEPIFFSNLPKDYVEVEEITESLLSRNYLRLLQTDNSEEEKQSDCGDSGYSDEFLVEFTSRP